MVKTIDTSDGRQIEFNGCLSQKPIKKSVSKKVHAVCKGIKESAEQANSLNYINKEIRCENDRTTTKQSKCFNQFCSTNHITSHQQDGIKN